MRIRGLDIFRGIAIVLMVVYHFCYFLNDYGFMHQNMDLSLFWRTFRAVIVTIFLFSAGVSLHIVYHKKIDIKKLLKRILLLGGVSAIITIATKVTYPNAWVYFGIIHFVTLSSVLGLLFINRFWLSMVVSVALFAGYFSNIIPYAWGVMHLNYIVNLPRYTVDLVPIFPWFWVIAFALGLSAKAWHIPLFNAIEKIFAKPAALLSILGKHTLLIYLTHLPLLFVVFEIIKLIGVKN